MDVRLSIRQSQWAFSIDASSDWSVPATLEEERTDAFGLDPTRLQPVPIGGGRRLVVAEGASVNCSNLHINPHGAGTHTECIGHISEEAREVRTLRIPALLPATVLSVVPVRLATTTERYDGTCHPDDRVVPVEPLARAFAELAQPGFDSAIVVRTREDDDAALSWSGRNPPYLTREAMAFLAALPTQHLLVDLPSIDREDDGGGVPNHLCWWGLPAGERSEAAARYPDRSLTELVHVPQHCGDGAWILGLQLPAVGGDAVPSRVLAWRPRQLRGKG